MRKNTSFVTVAFLVAASAAFGQAAAVPSTAVSPTATPTEALAPAAQPVVDPAPPSTVGTGTGDPAPAAPAGVTPTSAPPAGMDAAATVPESAGAGPQDEVRLLDARLEEANAIIDELRAEAWDLKDRAKAAEERAAAAELGAAANESEASRARELEAEAGQLRDQAEEMEARIEDLMAELAARESGDETASAAFASWGSALIDSAAFPELLHSGFAGVNRSMGSWKIENGAASQIDPKQFFSRLTFPVLQEGKPTLYSFETKTGKKGWVGSGLHFFADDVRKPRGYGEGKSLLLWFTRDEKARASRETWLQVYRSDDDVNMERILDARVQVVLEILFKVVVLYDPQAEFVVVAVNGKVRAAYRTFFGIGDGVSVSLRTLGEGVSFRNFEVRR